MKESVAPECGPFVLLTSPSAENTNATSQRSYNNTVGIGFLLCLHFSLVYPCKKKGKKCPCTTQHRLWSLTARLKRHPSPSALLFNKTSTVTVKTRTTTNTRILLEMERHKFFFLYGSKWNAIRCQIRSHVKNKPHCQRAVLNLGPSSQN